MTRTNDWRKQAQGNVTGVIDNLTADISERRGSIEYQADDLLDLATDENATREDLRDATDALRDALKDLATASFNHAYEVHKFKTGSTIRQLQGKEPVGYSKRDGGAAHDALYGSQAQGASFARHISWPLNLTEWEKEKGERTRSGVEPVSAEGTRKYTRRVGGREVSLVVDERTRDPPV